jgi:hypothetical protein
MLHALMAAFKLAKAGLLEFAESSSSNSQPTTGTSILYAPFLDTE